jgi:hypothetical protein
MIKEVSAGLFLVPVIHHTQLLGWRFAFKHTIDGMLTAIIRWL